MRKNKIIIFLLIGILIIIFLAVFLFNNFFGYNKPNSEIVYNYELMSSSDKTLTLSYANVNKDCMKIGFSFNNEPQYDKESFYSLTEKEKENILDSEIEKYLNNISEEGSKYPYIKTSNEKIFYSTRSNDGDSIYGKNIFLGSNDYSDTFSLTIDDATDELIVYFFNNENNQEIILNLKRIK